MTYDELVTYRDALESAKLTGAGVLSAEIDGKKVTFRDEGDLRRALNQVNRSISRCNQQQAGQTPGIRTASIG